VVDWYRPQKGGKPVLIASGRRTFTAAGTATIAIELTAAGRKELLRATHLDLTANGTFTPAGAPPVTATRRFTLRHRRRVGDQALRPQPRAESTALSMRTLYSDRLSSATKLRPVWQTEPPGCYRAARQLPGSS